MSMLRFTPIVPSTFDLERFFEDGLTRVSGLVPALDIYQTRDDVVVEAPLAGINPEQVSVAIENDVLTIEGKSEQQREVDEQEYYRKEVRYGSFHRSVALPAAVSGDKAKATYEQGVLKIVIPKEERVKPKTVKVEVK